MKSFCRTDSVSLLISLSRPLLLSKVFQLDRPQHLTAALAALGRRGRWAEGLFFLALQAERRQLGFQDVGGLGIRMKKHWDWNYLLYIVDYRSYMTCMICQKFSRVEQCWAVQNSFFSSPLIYWERCDTMFVCKCFGLVLDIFAQFPKSGLGIFQIFSFQKPIHGFLGCILSTRLGIGIAGYNAAAAAALAAPAWRPAVQVLQAAVRQGVEGSLVTLGTAMKAQGALAWDVWLIPNDFHGPEPEPCWFFLTVWEIYNLLSNVYALLVLDPLVSFQKVCYIHVYTHDFICISSAYRCLRYDNHPSKVWVELGHICCGPWRICFNAAWHLASAIATKQWNRVEQIHGISLCACWNGQPWEWWK